MGKLIAAIFFLAASAFSQNIQGKYPVTVTRVVGSWVVTVDTTLAKALATKPYVNSHGGSPDSTLWATITYVLAHAGVADSSVFATRYYAGQQKTDTTSLSNRVNVRYQPSDTSSTLSTKYYAGQQKIDTTSLSNRINLKYASGDTTSTISTKYFAGTQKVDTTSLSNRINGKYGSADTTSTLSTKYYAGTMKIDTTSLSNRINGKISGNQSITLSGAVTGSGVTAITTTLTAAGLDNVFSSTGLLKRTGAATYTLDANTYLTANQSITLSGDASGSGATAITVTNAKVNGVAYAASPTVGTYPFITSDNTATYPKRDTVLLLTALDTTTSGSLKDMAGFSVNILANEKWYFRFDLIDSMGLGAGGCKFAVTIPSGTLLASVFSWTNAVTAFRTDILTVSGTASATAVKTVRNTIGITTIVGTCVNGATPGNIQLRAQTVTAAQRYYLLAGSGGFAHRQN